MGLSSPLREFGCLETVSTEIVVDCEVDIRLHLVEDRSFYGELEYFRLQASVLADLSRQLWISCQN